MIINEILRYDPTTGKLFWTDKATRFRGLEAGGSTCIYRRVSINGRNYKVQRVAWYLTYGEWPTGVIDHINGNKYDNRLINLRDVTHRVNAQNKMVSKGNQSGWLGVIPSKNKKKWKAQIGDKGNTVYLGVFEDKADAYAAYLKAKRLLHAEGCTI